MKSRLAVVLALFLASTLFAVAQSANPEIQPVPVPNAPAPTGSDPNDSGYTSIFLLNHDWSADTSPDADNPFLRLEANRQRRGLNPDFVGDVLVQAQQQRALYPQLLPNAAPAAGVPAWFNIGSAKDQPHSEWRAADRD